MKSHTRLAIYANPHFQLETSHFARPSCMEWHNDGGMRV